MKRILIVLVATMLFGMAFAGAAEKDPQEIGQRIAPPSFGPLSGEWCSAPNLAIPDNDAGAAVDVLTVPDSETISNLDVAIQIQHTWIGDLRAQLSSAACTVQLFSRIGLDGVDGCCGCSGDDIDVLLDDDAASSIETSCDTGGSGGAAGTFQPGDPVDFPADNFAMCNGGDTAGDWTLTVTDGAGGDLGTVLEWCLISTTGGGDGGDGGDGGQVPAVGPFGLLLTVLALGGASGYVISRRRK